MTAPCAIEYILVTRWRGGKKGGQNRVCACDTRDRGVNKKLKPEHPSEDQHDDNNVKTEDGNVNSLVLLPALQNLAPGWNRINEDLWAMRSTVMEYQDTTLVPADTMLWFRSTLLIFLLYAAWVRSRAERPSVSYTKVVMEVAWTGHNLQFTKTN